MAQDEKKSLQVSHHGGLHRILKQRDKAWIWRGKIHQKVKNLCFQKSHVKKTLTNFLIRIVLSTENSIQRAKPLLQHIRHIMEWLFKMNELREAGPILIKRLVPAAQ
jgi:hypothetical protein